MLSIFLFALMLLFPADTLSGASAGLLLWFRTVLPTLLPAMILADYLIRVGADRYISRLAARPFGLLFGVSPQGAYAVLVGFLCGYPMGAKTSASLLSEGRIDRREASYLLSFCNQPSPMFLTGFLCLSLLQTPEGGAALVLPMLAGVYGSAFFISACYRALRRMDRRLRQAFAFDEAPSPAAAAHHAGDAVSAAAPVSDAVSRRGAGNASSAKKATDSSPLSLLEASMMTSFEVMVKIGGYMMLFSILEVWIQRLSLLGPAPQSVLMGFVEMTTGSRQISLTLALPWSAVLCCGVTAFGGLSGFAQTANVLKGSGLSCGRYFGWKLLQGALAAAIALAWFLLCEGFLAPV